MHLRTQVGSQQEPFWRDLLLSSCCKQSSDTYTASITDSFLRAQEYHLHARTHAASLGSLSIHFPARRHAAVNFPEETEGRWLQLRRRCTAASFRSGRAVSRGCGHSAPCRRSAVKACCQHYPDVAEKLKMASSMKSNRRLVSSFSPT